MTAAAKRAIDPETAFQVFVGATEIDVALYSVDYANGIVTSLDGEYFGESAAAVTFTGKYLPLFTIGEAKTADVVLPQPQMADGTRLGDAAKRQIEIAKRASVTLTHFSPLTEDIDTTGASFTMEMVQNGDRVFLEVALSTVQTMRGWFAPMPASVKHGVDALMETTVEFRGVVQTCVGRPVTDQALFQLT